MLATRNVRFTYPGGRSFDFPDISLKGGEHALMLGSSGSGKTTLLHMMAGILIPQTGDIAIDGTQINKLSGATLDRFRGRHIGLVFQRHFFIDSISMLDNLILAQTLSGAKPDVPYLESMLHDLNLTNLSQKSPVNLSMGELQRFSIARALANRPMLVLADEPTSSLDDINCNLFADLLLHTAAQCGSALLIATHDARLKPAFSYHFNL